MGHLVEAFHLGEDGSLEGKITLTFTGLEAINRRQEHYNQDAEERKKYLEGLLKEYVPGAMEADLTNQPGWTASETPLVAEFDAKIPGWASGAGRRALLAAGIFSATERQIFQHSDRVNAVYFPFLFRKVDDVTIELPLDWKVSSLPKDQDQDAKAAQYTLKFEQKSGAVHITRVLRSDLIMIPKDSYPALRNFYQAVKSGDEQQIVLQPGASAASN